MAEDNKKVETDTPEQKVASVVAKSVYGDGAKRQRGGVGGGRGPRRGGRDERKDEFEQRILEISRVTRVMGGGKRMSFRACVAIGDRKGSIGLGLGKGADVTMAVNKAVNRAKKDMLKVPVVKDTIPHAVSQKLGAANIIFKPAKQGRGVIAGGVARAILELAGIKNVTSKVLGTNNKINNARCTFAALASLRQVDSKPGAGGSKMKAKEENTEKKEEIQEKEGSKPSIKKSAAKN